MAQGRILDLLEEIVSSRGQGLLLVTHDMGVVARLAHEVAVMDRGRIVEHCDVNTLFSAPRHPVSQRRWRRTWRCTEWSLQDEPTECYRRQPRLPAPSGRAARRQPERPAGETVALLGRAGAVKAPWRGCWSALRHRITAR